MLVRERIFLTVRGVLGPAGRGVFPFLLAPVGDEIEDVVDEEKSIHPTGGGGVGPIDIRAVAQEHAEHEPGMGTAVVREGRTV
jgi:hypothetical protein